MRPTADSTLSQFRLSRQQRIVIHALQVGALLCVTLGVAGPLSLSRYAGLAALVATGVSLLAGVVMGSKATQRFDALDKELGSAHETRRQIEELFAMTDMLQAADGLDDAGAILRATSERLLPLYSGALYVFNNSRDRLDLAAKWNTFEGFQHPDVLLPSSCWALKRGKPHINDPVERTLCCEHHDSQRAAVEIPMMARNELHGLLVFASDAEGAFADLMEIRRLARALADSMSLALSNIELRDKLRTQSLRDPLTGLYNRRYMEDALDRYVNLAERSGAPTSVMMIDLDNFKQLNDGFGHAKGDAVLRDVAAQLVGALRPSDVVARFGGEELMVILPNCELANAEAKAEMLRLRIEALSELHKAPISASFGLACIPETSSGPADVQAMADTALYAAKQAGKNCVRCADRRASQPSFEPRLAFG